MAKTNASPVDAYAAAAIRDLAGYLETLDDFSEVLSSLNQGHGGTLGGVWGSSRALVAAALQRACTGTLLVVLPHAADIDVFVSDLELFTSASVAPLPAWETDAGERVLHDDIFGARLRVLKSAENLEVVVTSIQSLLQPVPSQETLAAATRNLTVGEQLDEAELARWLVEHGCTNTTAVELPGEFSIRGGIVDVFPPDALDPFRIELFGDEIESIRTFDVATQRSLESLQVAPITMLAPSAQNRTHFASYLSKSSWVMLVEPSELEEEGRYYHRRQENAEDLFATSTTLKELYKFPSVTAAGVPSGSYETTAHLQFESVEQFSGDVSRVKQELEAAAAGQQVFLVCDADSEAERLAEVFAESSLLVSGNLRFALGHLKSGFRLVGRQTVLISAAELFQRQELVRGATRKTGRAIDSFLELRDGDLVVHLSHGIGRYRGLRLIEKADQAEEHLELEYDGGTRIFVPVSKIELVQKYIGGRKAKPKLAKIGGKAWARQKLAAEKAVVDMAADMIQVQATRAARPGIAFPEDTQWLNEFENAFPYQETPDQLSAIAAIKSDMQEPKPMDRLLCGDVGFGKTEMAIRAAFKAIDAGYQVAVLVPTTVLAEQHRRT
ncbi:MAG: CarD family transcriptional regulator, partial [Lacipirellulaceae bacterium]